MQKQLLTGLLVCFALQGCGSEKMITVEAGLLPQNINLTGELVSANTVQVSPPVVNRVWQYQVKTLATEGSFVKEGQTIATLDTSELMQRLQNKSSELATIKQDIKTTRIRMFEEIEQLKLNIAEAKMNYEKAKRKFDLSDETVAEIEKKKYENDALISKRKVKLTQQLLELEKQSLKQRLLMLESDQKKMAAEVKELQQGIVSFNIKTPKEGMLVYEKDFNGEKVKEGHTLYAGMGLVSIPDLTEMQVKMSIPEIEAHRVQVGQVVSIRLDANPEKEFKGKISQLGKVFRSKSWNVPLVVFDAIADIEGADQQIMKPGMTAKISIDVSSPQTQLLLPKAAIYYENGLPTVNKETFLSSSQVFIEIEQMSESMVSISKGLEAGDKVVLR